MRLWLSVSFISTVDLCPFVRRAEDLGVAGIAISEHQCVPRSISSPYPYGSRSDVTLPVDAEFPDPLIAAAGIASGTKTIRLMSNVLIGPLRHPATLAKEVATIAALSASRFDLGLGVGWMREEYDMLGVPFGERGRRLDEMTPLMRALWHGEEVVAHGSYFAWDDPVSQYPLPPQAPPIFFGGSSDAALRRAARDGDGWVGANLSEEEIEACVKTLHGLRGKRGAQGESFEHRTSIRGPLTLDRLQTVAQSGIDALIVTPSQVVPAATPYSVNQEDVLAGVAEWIPMVETLAS